MSGLSMKFIFPLNIRAGGLDINLTTTDIIFSLQIPLLNPIVPSPHAPTMVRAC